MTIDQLNEKLKLLENEYLDKKNKLYREYLAKNNPYKKGDIFQDHKGKIKIEYSYITLGLTGEPLIYYSGPCLNNDGSLKKIESTREAYLCNEIKNHK